MKSRTSVVVVLCVTVFAGMVGANEWTGAIDTLWDEPGNWSQNVVPLSGWQDPFAGWDDPACPCYPLTSDPSDDGPVENNNAQLRYQGGGVPTEILIDESTLTPGWMMNPGPGAGAYAYGVRVGNSGGDVTLRIEGGSLEIGGVPPSSSSGDRAGWHFDIGRGFETHTPGTSDSAQRVVMTGGEVNTNGLLIPEQFVDDSLTDPTDSAPLNGELIMSGGTITARWMNLGQLKGNGTVELSGDAVINLYPTQPSDINNGGHFSFNRNWFLQGQPVPSSGNVSLDLSDNATINIFGTSDEFTNTPNQDEVDRYQGYIDDAHDPMSNQALTAWGGTADPIITLQECPEDPDPLAQYCVNNGGMMITITAPQVDPTCDFDGSGGCDEDDINMLMPEIASGMDNPDFDLNGDNVVDTGDRDQWLEEAGTLNIGAAYLVADFNLDGDVDGQDFVAWNGSKFTANTDWTAGNANGDFMVDGQDFVAWNGNKFTSSNDFAAVPEPASMWLGLLGLLVLGRRCR